jgi:serine/threonine-protein kinase
VSAGPSSRSVRYARTGLVPTLIVAGAALFAALLFGISPTFNPIDLIRGYSAEVPKVTGLTQTKALLELQNAHLKGDVTFAQSSRAKRGFVAIESPAAGVKVGRDSTVHLVVSTGPSYVTLPNVVLQPVTKAKKTLEKLGVDVVIHKVFNEDAPAGLVISQKPTAGHTVPGGTKVTLEVSEGPAIRTVPDLKGLPLEGAAFRLGQAGLALGKLSLTDDASVPQGSVISTNPPAGQQRQRDTPVDIVVSSGAPAVGVPDLTGVDQKTATDRLTAVGLLAGEVIQVGTVADPLDGKVISQVPAAGTLLKPGQVVTLTIRKAAPPPTTTVPPTTAPPPTTPPTTATPAAPPTPGGP